jgi:hypothetical protein
MTFELSSNSSGEIREWISGAQRMALRREKFELN